MCTIKIGGNVTGKVVQIGADVQVDGNIVVDDQPGNNPPQLPLEEELLAAAELVTTLLLPVAQRLTAEPGDHQAMRAYALQAVLDLLIPFEIGSTDSRADATYWAEKLRAAQNMLYAAQMCLRRKNGWD